MMDKKAQGLPITTIIIAILGLVVLVILFAILTGRLAIFAGAANECPGVCVVDKQTLPDDVTVQPGILEDLNRVPSGPQFTYEAKNKYCKPDIERELFGKFVARDIRDKKGRPIPCKKCCQSFYAPT